MAKIEKRFLSFGLVLALMVALSSVCFAEEFNFSNLKKSVDSNSWSYIGSATKDSATENGELKITKMYDADGDETSLPGVRKSNQQRNFHACNLGQLVRCSHSLLFSGS